MLFDVLPIKLSKLVQEHQTVVQKSRLILVKLMIVSWALSSEANAVTLPSRLPAFAQQLSTIDPALEVWLQKNAEVTPVSDLSDEQLLAWVSAQDPLTKAMIVLNARRSSASKKSPKRDDTKIGGGSPGADLEKLRAQILVDAPGLIKKELAKKAEERSPLLAELYLLWSAQAKPSDESEALEYEIFAQEPKASCAGKSHAIKGISKERLSSASTEELVKMVVESDNYRSLLHRRRYLESIAASLPDKRRAEILDPMKMRAKELPVLMRRFSWLQSDDFFETYPNSTFAEATNLIRKKKCSEAESAFLKQLKSNIPQSTISIAMDTGVELERCFRAEKKTAANLFWSRVLPTIESRYGKEGSYWVKVRLGYVKWVASDLDEAVKIFDEILKATSGDASLRALEAKANYMLGKVAEDRNELELAAKYFKTYIEKYPDLEDFELAMNSLVVNHAAKKQWNDLLVPLEGFLRAQSKVHMDKRPVGLMAFSLFWQGRAYLELGNTALAQEIWRRLAGEYYSTFYGAMGHYLMEQTSGRSFAIEPSRVKGFDFDAMTKKLNESNRAATRRAVAFLQAGIPEKARCEVDEVVAENQNDHNAMLVRTLLLHASGGWLDAIKIFDVMPRTVRNALPAGFERVLFPRKFAEIVKAKSAKLDLDPDFVFALMRQESVFSPDAVSPVGAVGLMQLMPATAKLEVSKLSSDYVESEIRNSINHALVHEDSLRDPELNVTLGVHHLWRLMKAYKSPVFALTAYNASPAATQKWQRSIATDDWLTFIERIPYKETRAYVKLILRNYFYYKRWYNSPDGKGQVHIDTVVDDLVAIAKGGNTNKDPGPPK